MPLIDRTFSDIITFTRASTGTFFDSAGVLQSAAINAPRFDYNPATLAARGLLIEEARTNSIRNNTMQGAVAGTPGTLPTNWQRISFAGGLTQQIVGVGTAAGISYIDIKISGTPTDTTGFLYRSEPNTQIAASSGQTWTGSQYLALVSGSTLNISNFNQRVVERDAAGGYLVETPTSLSGITANFARFATTRIFNNASTAFTTFETYCSTTIGQAIDITLRIGLPQLELGAFATSVIPTTTTALTRSADVASVNTLSPWYNTSGGTIYAEATGPIASIYRMLAEGATASDFRDFSLAFDGLRGNFAARYVAGNFDVLGPTNSLTAGAAVKLAGSYSATSADMAYNGVLAVSKNAITQRIPADRMFLGSRLGSSLQLNGYLRRVTYYKRRLSNAQLQAITQ